VRIVEEDKKNTTFATEWGSYAYNIIPFELKSSFLQDSYCIIQGIYTQVPRSVFG
jgi:hypothetical protein